MPLKRTCGFMRSQASTAALKASSSKPKVGAPTILIDKSPVQLKPIAAPGLNGWHTIILSSPAHPTPLSAKALALRGA